MMTKQLRHLTQNATLAGALTILFVALFTLSACSTAQQRQEASETKSVDYEEGVPGGIVVDTVKLSVRVTAIDTANRKLTLLMPDGSEDIVKMGPEAVNFDKIQKGDLVNVIVIQEMITYIDKEGASAPADAGGSVPLAPEGAQPGGLMVETEKFFATITAIDQTKRTVKLGFEDGSSNTIPVRDDIDLSQLKVGEKVVFQATESIAISVEKP